MWGNPQSFVDFTDQAIALFYSHTYIKNFDETFTFNLFSQKLFFVFQKYEEVGSFSCRENLKCQEIHFSSISTYIHVLHTTLTKSYLKINFYPQPYTKSFLLLFLIAVESGGTSNDDLLGRG